MKKVNVDIIEYTKLINEMLPKGILLTTKGEKINSMVIGWGALGVNWSRKVFIVYVREGRYTRELLDKSMEFTINIPFKEVDRKIMGVLGSKSGRDLDKIKECNLTPVEGNQVNVPGLKEFPLTIECKVIYRQKEELDLIPLDIQNHYYPRNEKDPAKGLNSDVHVMYIGEILDTYIIE